MVVEKVVEKENNVSYKEEYILVNRCVFTIKLLPLKAKDLAGLNYGKYRFEFRLAKRLKKGHFFRQYP